MKITGYRIPALGQEPSEEMIEWLHTMPNEWDGDDSGITICSLDGNTENDKTGGPGDWVICADGVWTIVKDAEAPECLK